MKPNYVVRGSNTKCPDCRNTEIVFLAREDFDTTRERHPAFYICHKCGWVGQFGIGGSVRREVIYGEGV